MKDIFTICFFILLFNSVMANNIQVTSAILTNQNTSGDYTSVQFNLSWENSWRDAINWDAAWIFIKYKASYDTLWKHATLSSTEGNHVIPSGFVCSPMSDGVGILIYRNANGNGNNNLSGVQLRWMYGLNGVNDGDIVSVKVFAIEMVYVPQGSFYAGDGNVSMVTGQFSQGNTTAPYLISSENALTLGSTITSNLGNRNCSGMNTQDDFNNSTTQTLPAAFPKGYNDFYCMKYEISQGQYTEFLNTLSRWKQRSRVASDISGDAVTNIYVMSNTSTISYRNVITCPASGNGTVQPLVFSCSRPDRASNYISWMDGCAYLDWAGLRPMTELEIEKASRGPLTPIPGEFAWGTTLGVSAGMTISGTENGTEYILNPLNNINCDNITFSGGDGGNGPLRCGIFASVTWAITRERAGATFYGIMEMSGNIYERSVTVGNSTGRGFTGSHGNGQLSINGYSDNSDWPGYNSGEITGALGSNYRMGSWGFNNSYSQISERTWGAYNGPPRTDYNGIRGVRTSLLGTMNPQKKNEEKRIKINE
jgi:formylglycine-generating enzyme required for sulfatase activity